MKIICMAIIMVMGGFNAWAQIPRDPPPLSQPANSQNRVMTAAPSTNIIGGTLEDRLRMSANSNLASNLPPFALTNRLGLTNGLTGTNRFLNITNKLSTLSPEHVRAVRQVQTSLNSLQQAAAKLRNTPNIDEVMDESPYLQQQLGIINAELNELTQGTVRPSSNMVGRLSRNLARALVTTQLSEDQQLAVSAAINEIANSGDLTQAEIDESISTVQAVLHTGGAGRMVVDPVTRDLRAFALEVQPRIAQ